MTGDKDIAEMARIMGPSNDDALLASVMRKLLNTEGYGNWGDGNSPVPNRGQPWITIDTSWVPITAEELAAVERAVQE